MPCLTTLPIAARRLPPSLPASAQDDERQRHAFQQWLMPPTRPDSPAADEPPAQGAHQALVLELLPYQRQLEQLGQFSQSTLTLRLTNGLLAGLEICATARGETLHVQVRTPDRARFEQIAGAGRALENDLAQRFQRPVTLEVDDALATTE